MWIFFDGGFVSIVEDQVKPVPRGQVRWLLVRARQRADLEEFAKLASSKASIVETPENDYRYRASMRRSEVTRALHRIALAVDYGNFKDRVHERDPKRAAVYHDVWFAASRVDSRRRR